MQGDALAPYRRDLTRRLASIDEEVGAIRALSSDINDTIWSMRDYQQELIAKKVAGWAAILAIPAILTGRFGTNVPYPGERARMGRGIDGRLHRRLDGRLLRQVPQERLDLIGSNPGDLDRVHIYAVSKRA